MKKAAKLISFGWLGSVVFLFFYSFTQIDLGLTLTRFAFWQPIQKSFQKIGYFNRPLSAGLYLGILLLLFIFYSLILLAVEKKWFKDKKLWLLIFFTAGLLWFSYNAFSYDLFNYVFDAKIVTHYQLNPFQYRAQDFPGDPMLGFMHWTHRFYPYGPSWLVFTIPLSYLGFGKLVPTMLLIKGLAVVSYLAASWWLYQLLALTDSKRKLFGLAVFAFNPLVVIESLVSAHNDILMMALVLGAFWFFNRKKSYWGWLLFFLSAGVKFATLILFPVFLWISWQQRRNKPVDWQKVWWFSLGLMVVAVWAVIIRDELKTWYLLYLLPFLPLLSGKKKALVFTQKNFFWPIISLSFGLLLYYLLFLYLGNWDPPVAQFKSWLTFISLGLGLGISLFSLGKKRFSTKTFKL